MGSVRPMLLIKASELKRLPKNQIPVFFISLLNFCEKSLLTSLATMYQSIDVFSFKDSPRREKSNFHVTDADPANLQTHQQTDTSLMGK